VAIIGTVVVADSSSNSTHTDIFTSISANKNECDSSYPTVCMPPSPPDLDCKDISYYNFPLLSADPHRLDRDSDGIGCER
jgi:hypothetical protein